VLIRVTTGGVEITEGGRKLAAEAVPPAGGPVGQIRAYYDGGVLEVFSLSAPAAAAICRRDGSYSRLDVDVASRPGAPRERALVTVWSCG
jgi:hypothetical protein